MHIRSAMAALLVLVGTLGSAAAQTTARPTQDDRVQFNVDMAKVSVRPYCFGGPGNVSCTDRLYVEIGHQGFIVELGGLPGTPTSLPSFDVNKSYLVKTTGMDPKHFQPSIGQRYVIELKDHSEWTGLVVGYQPFR